MQRAGAPVVTSWRFRPRALAISASGGASRCRDQWHQARGWSVDIVLGVRLARCWLRGGAGGRSASRSPPAALGVSSVASGPAVLAAVSLADPAVLADGGRWPGRRRWRPRPRTDLARPADRTASTLLDVNIAWSARRYPRVGHVHRLAPRAVWTLRERAERAEAEQELRVGAGAAAERARIAREMHDVLAHRISRSPCTPGRSAYRSDLAAEQMRDNAAVDPRRSANEALTELRGVLGVLREPEPAGRPTRPQPTWPT